MSEPLAELMQRLYRDRAAGRWSDGLGDGVRRKVEARFVRVLYEACTRSADASVAGEAAFRRDLDAAWRQDPEVTVLHLTERHGLRHWRFDPPTGHIQMVFQASVYDGDVDHRH